VKPKRPATLLPLLVLALFVVRCGKQMDANQPTPVHVADAPSNNTGDKYVGAWRSKEATIVIKKEGDAFTVQPQGPAGPKEIGIFANGVMRVDEKAALYTPSIDRLVFDGQEFQRIDPRVRTLTDLEAIGNAIHEYTRQNSYGSPPVNDVDFFVGVPRIYPDMSRQDGWGTRYRYLYKFGQRRWAVVSAGPDGSFDPLMTADMVADGMIRASGDDIAITDSGFAPGVRP
jgi:hypothetical protein